MRNKRAGRIKGWILQRLRGTDGITAEPGQENDIIVQILGGPAVPIDFEVEHRVSEDRADKFVESNSLRPRNNTTVALVTTRLTPGARKALRRAGISWFEYQTGVVHLRAPGIAIDLPESYGIQPSLIDEKPLPRLPSFQGMAGVVVEALIVLSGKHQILRQSEIAETAGVTQAWTSRILRSLVAAMAVEEIGSGPQKRWRADLPALLEIWVADGGAKPEKTAGVYVWARHETELLEMLPKLEGPNIAYAVGGVVAADLYEPTLTSRPNPHIWIPSAVHPVEIARAMGGEVVSSGANLHLWQHSRDPALRLRQRLVHSRALPHHELLRDLWLVSKPRAYIEAQSETGRAQDVASTLRRSLLNELEGE